VRTSLLLLLIPVAVSSPTLAQPNQIKRGPIPAWVHPSDLLPVPENVGGPVFIRRQDVLIHLDEKGQSQHLGYRIKILNSSALQIGNVSLAWNPAAGTPTVHSIKVYRDNQTIDVLEKSSFEVLRREDQLEASRLDGNLTAVLRVPDLRVDDELQVELTTPVSDPTLGKDLAGLLFLGPTPPPGRLHLGLSWETERKPGIKISPDMVSSAVYRPNAIDFRFDNAATQIPLKDAPARYQWQRTVEYSTFADWPSLSRKFAPLYAKASKLSGLSPVRQEAARIAAAHSGLFERASAALKVVQQDVRYIYVGLNGGNLMPATADETWQRRYGDCKAKTVLLLSLLSELGIEAEAVLVNANGADDGLDERLPSPQVFDHVLVRARINGAAYWLDGTLPPVAIPSLAPVFPLNWVLPLTGAGMSIERREWKPSAAPDEIRLHEIDARAGFDKPARITSTSIVRGIKGLQEQAQFSSVPAAQLLSTLRQQLIGDTWQSIEDVQWRYDPVSAASILKIVGSGLVNWDDDGDGAKSVALPGGGFNPPEKRVRSSDQSQAVPYYVKPEFFCHVTTVRLPVSTKPEQWSSRAGFDVRIFGRHYYRAFDLRDGAIRMVRGSRVEQREIDPVTAQQDNRRISSFDNSMGSIFFSPASQRTTLGNGARVPATYEIDWTASVVPCLSSVKGS
jgi:transglutaminase-like putative cysteine protease